MATRRQTIRTSTRAGSTNFNHGAEGQVLVDGSPNQQGLIRFDNLVGNGASQVGAGTPIQSAKLRILTGSTTNDQSNNDFGLYTMLRSWTDSDTYDSLVGGVSTDGVEASSTPTFTLLPNQQGAYVVFDVTDTVQAWVDGTLANNGWMLKDLTGTDGWRFISSDNATIGDRPYLEITVPEPASLTLVVVFGLACLAYRPQRGESRRAAAYSRTCEGKMPSPRAGRVARATSPVHHWHGLVAHATACSLLPHLRHIRLVLRFHTCRFKAFNVIQHDRRALVGLLITQLHVRQLDPLCVADVKAVGRHVAEHRGLRIAAFPLFRLCGGLLARSPALRVHPHVARCARLRCLPPGSR